MQTLPRGRALTRFLPLALLFGLAMSCTGCRALIFAFDDDCHYRSAPRCGPSVVVVPRRRCR